MARDLRQTCSLNDYPDRCYYYDSSAVKHNKLVQDAKPLGRFYKRDKVAFAWKPITINGVISNTRRFIGVVETMDHVEKLRPDMFVLDQTGMLFRVTENIISDDENRSKNVGRRPCVRTTFTLQGLETIADRKCE